MTRDQKLVMIGIAKACGILARQAALGLVLSATSTSGLAAMPAREPTGPTVRYVALGSSFAAGPGIPPATDGPARCSRSTENYAHQIARRRRWTLVDASCSGATTENVLRTWNELPAQVDALDEATRIVTVTIGGNDVNYLGILSGDACRKAPPADWACPTPPLPDEAIWRKAERGLQAVAAEVHRRSPAARLIFVDYLNIVPTQGSCRSIALTAARADAARVLARRLARLIARAAKEADADLIRASDLSMRHDACSPDPWVHGWVRPSADQAPFHPNREGMSAIADSIDEMIRSPENNKLRRRSEPRIPDAAKE